MKVKLLVLSAACVILLAVNFQTSFAGQKGVQPPYQFTSVNVMGKETEAYGINQGGAIVGRFVGSSSLIKVYHGFMVDRDSTATIDVPNNLGADTVIYGINSRGKVVGGYTASGKYHGFLDEGGSFTTIDVPEADGTIAHGINEQLLIVGEYTDGLGTHGFLRDSLGFTTIDVMDDAGIAFPTTVVYGINRAGQFVGTFRDWTGKSHGFFEEDGILTEINYPDQLATDTFAYGINPQGQIVGSYINDSGTHGFLYDDGVFTPINVNFQGARDTSVFGINRHGNIVGTYTDANGKIQGFVGE